MGEATNANVAFFAGGALVTPSVDGLLPGVCRAALLEAARGLGLAVESRPVALAELIDADGVLTDVVAARHQRGGRAGRSRAAARAAPTCSPRCARAWPRRRAPTRWRYRDRVSPVLAAGARVLADVVPARGIEPAAALHALAGPGSVLLESGEGRWSYLAPWPAAVLSRRDPVGALEEARACSTGSRPTCPPGAPPSPGGLLGSLGYDLARALESIPQLARDDLGLPAIQLAAVDSLYAFDRERDELWIVARAERELRRLREGLERVRPVARPAAPGDELRGMPYAHYRARVERVLDHIARGDVYEVNYTQRLEGNCASALDLYARLRESAPVPYNLYLDAGGWQLVGATPETFLRVGADGRCETRPIKGTRPRDDDPAPTPRSPPIWRRIRRTAPRT